MDAAEQVLGSSPRSKAYIQLIVIKKTLESTAEVSLSGATAKTLLSTRLSGWLGQASPR